MPESGSAGAAGAQAKGVPLLVKRQV